MSKVINLFFHHHRFEAFPPSPALSIIKIEDLLFHNNFRICFFGEGGEGA